MSTLKEFYTGEVIPELQRQFGYKSPMQLPKLWHITLNMGVGEAVQTPKLLENATEELSLIAGQRAVITRAKKSIANFKIRDGMPIGCKVTLRRNHMYEFYNKLVNLSKTFSALKLFRSVTSIALKFSLSILTLNAVV